MKNKVSATILAVAMALAMALTLASCGAKSVEGAYTYTPSWDDITELNADEAEAFSGAAFWDMGISIAGIEAYTAKDTIDFKSDGTYTYTMLSVLSDNIDAGFDRETTAYVELVYTGTYSAGDKGAWVLSCPTECVWSYNPGLFAELGSQASANNSYTAGATTIAMFGDMGGAPADVMSAFGHKLIHLSETADTTATMTVTLDSSNNTFTIA